MKDLGIINLIEGGFVNLFQLFMHLPEFMKLKKNASSTCMHVLEGLSFDIFLCKINLVIMNQDLFNIFLFFSLRQLGHFLFSILLIFLKLLKKKLIKWTLIHRSSI